MCLLPHYTCVVHIKHPLRRNTCDEFIAARLLLGKCLRAAWLQPYIHRTTVETPCFNTSAFEREFNGRATLENSSYPHYSWSCLLYAAPVADDAERSTLQNSSLKLCCYKRWRFNWLSHKFCTNDGKQTHSAISLVVCSLLKLNWFSVSLDILFCVSSTTHL